MNSYSLVVLEIRKETDEARTICFKQPALRKIKYQAGQYISLNLRINGRKYSRAYSFSSSPSLNKNLEITVKKVRDGVVSNYLNNELKVGDVIEVNGPKGKFLFNENFIQNRIYFWGVGSGITPLYSIINEILATRNDISIHLIYGNKNRSTSIFLKELEDLSNSNQGKFTMTNFYTNDDRLFQSSSKINGRINDEFVSMLNSQNPNFSESSHLICGPKEMKEKLIQSLISFGVQKNSILSEEFSFELGDSELALLENCTATMLFKGKEFEIFVPKGKSVLDVALDNEVEIPYSCQTGDCGSCKAILIDGKISHFNIDEQFGASKANQILLCCSYPITKEIVIEIE